MQTITLSRSVAYEGKTYEKLDLDLDGLSGADLENCLREADALTPDAIPVPWMNLQYQMAVAARAAKVPVDMLRHLGAKDFTRVTMAVYRFLAVTG